MSQGRDRRRDAAERAALEASARRAEAEEAQRLVDAFVVAARERGIAPEPLVATQLDGRRVKTDRSGWYLNARRSVAVGEDGGWYVLLVPSSTLGRFRGVRLEASDPELAVGKNGRDGEGGVLTELLDRILEGWRPPPG